MDNFDVLVKRRIVPVDQRVKSWRCVDNSEETELVKPFENFDALFHVPANLIKWILTDEKIAELRVGWKKLDNLTSGISHDKGEELIARQKIAGNCHEIGKIMLLPQRVTDVAIVFIHRFLIFHPHQLFPSSVLCACALNLALKVEFHMRPMEQLIKAVTMANENSERPTVLTESFVEEISQLESFMLATVGFDFDSGLPDIFIEAAGEMLGFSEDRMKAIRHFASKSLRLTTFCIKFPPKLIAALSFYHVSLREKFKIRDYNYRPWYYLFDDNIELEMLKEVNKMFWSSSGQAHNVVFMKPMNGPVNSVELEENKTEQSNNRRSKFESERNDFSSSKATIVQRAIEILQRAVTKTSLATDSLTSFSMRQNSGQKLTTADENVISAPLKYVKSTVLMKMKPPKLLAKKDEENSLTLALPTTTETYVPVHASKRRISHFKRTAAEQAEIDLKKAILASSTDKLTQSIKRFKSQTQIAKKRSSETSTSEFSEDPDTSELKKPRLETFSPECNFATGCNSVLESSVTINEDNFITDPVPAPVLVKTKKDKKRKHHSKKEKDKKKKNAQLVVKTTNDPMKIVIKSVFTTKT